MYKCATQQVLIRKVTVGYTIIISIKKQSKNKELFPKLPALGGDGGVVLIMTFLAFSSTNILNCHTIHFVILYIVVEFFVNAVKFISRAIIIIKIHFRFAVAVDAPAHA
jgi:hypothetical protein